MANTLSSRQQNILKFIISFSEENKFPPSIREIGEKVGISSTSVVNYNLTKLQEMELVNRQPEKSRGLSINWPKLAEAGLGGAPNLENVQRNAIFGGNRVRVPVLGIIAAGEPIGSVPRSPAETDEWVDLAEGIAGSAEGLFALRVKGDSMIDASVLNGDIVILRHQQTAEDGDMVAAWIAGDEETTLKYFFRQGKEIRLQPANPSPEFKPIIRPANMVQINGKVVSVLRVYH